VIVTTADEMRRIDAYAIERCGMPAATLMENAGAGAAAALLDRFPHVRKTGVVVVAGKGNNGGDGFVVARALKRRRVRCEVFLTAPRGDVRDTARAKLLAWERAGGRTTVLAGDLGPLQRALGRAGCVVDALLGTGLAGEVRGLVAEAITLVNASGVPTVALDIPSGLDSDRGVPLGVAIEAELTATFAAPKVGMILFPGARYTGELAVVDIGIPDEAFAAVGPQIEAVLADDAAALVRPRDPESHKGTNGHVAVVAGGRGKTGAAVLACRAAMRVGAGLVTAGVPAGELATVAARLLEEMTAPLPDDGEGGLAFPSPHAYAALLAGKSALVTGPGIGVAPDRRALVEWLVREAPVPAVLDADALNCLAASSSRSAWGTPDRPRVVTPHPGEMARLSGRSTAEVQSDRIGVARDVAAARGVIVVLKGARTIIAEPDGRVAVNCSGNPGLGSGGTGDVLAGVLGGLLAQGYPPRDAARLGVFLHGFAADRVADRRGTTGLLASDVIDELPAATAALASRARAAATRAASGRAARAPAASTRAGG
jgi:NAD(P)H-hydrate epimerase